MLDEPKYENTIYSISVFTHLSENISKLWIKELFRITKPGAILEISTKDDSVKKFLLKHELKTYNEKGKLVRGEFKEGKNMFFACHSPSYLKENLFNEFEILEFKAEGFPFTGQDC